MVVSDLFGEKNLTSNTVRSKRAGTGIDNFEGLLGTVRLFTRLKGVFTFSVEREVSMAGVVLPLRVKRFLAKLIASLFNRMKFVKIIIRWVDEDCCLRLEISLLGDQ